MDPVTGLSLGRAAIGAVSLSAPEVAGRLFRLDPSANRQLPYLTRMFGSREVALGVVTLLARGRARRTLVVAGVFVDACDAWAGVDAGRRGLVDRPTSAFLTAPALAAVAAGAGALVRRARTA